MFDDLLLHPASREILMRFIEHPSQVVLLTGPASIGKHMIAQRLAAELLSTQLSKLPGNGMYREIISDKNVINIEQIRNLFQFFALKATGKSNTRRVVVIPDAELMNQPAQNALLKMLEEPPSDAVILLTSSAPHKLLPTISSRVQSLTLSKPTHDAVEEYLDGKYPLSDVKRAFVMGDGRIGAMLSVLKAADDDTAVSFDEIRRILGLTIFDQLLLVDTALKDKDVAKLFVDRLEQVSSASLLQTAGNAKAVEQWKRISQASYVAGDALMKNGNPKLVLTELMLSLRA